MVFPVQSMSSYGSGGQRVQGVPGRGRGRPRGTLDKRYAQFGGVYGYRRWVGKQKRALREQLMRQKEAMKVQRIPEYEKEQYKQAYPTQAGQMEQMSQVQQMPTQQEQQLPPELQGQNLTPEYSQFEQQQQIQQQ
jgi:hypothetical protein